MPNGEHHQKEDKKYDVIVVGGGSAGMMAAGIAAMRGKQVLLLEKNKRLGEKLRISGGGRCNITNAQYDQRALLKNYGKAEKFLYSAFSQFGVTDTFDFFAEHNLPLVIEENQRAFPYTHKAEDVEYVLEQLCKNSGVEIQTGTAVKEIVVEEGSIVGVRMHTGNEYRCTSLVLATGGLSHPETGSTGDGFLWLSQLGHALVKPTPSLVPIKVRDAWVKKLAGLTLVNIKIHFFVNKKKRLSKFGNVLCTHFGLSGPLILNIAKDIADLLHEGAVTGTIDLYPAKDLHTLDQELLAHFDANKNKLFKNSIKEFLPAGRAEGILEFLGLALGETKVHSITKDSRKEIAALLKALPITVEGLMGYDKAVIADGGVSITEIDTRTMRSKKHQNLFLVGDLLHINRPSGGFSLQLCWTTGYVAGKHVGG